MKQSRAQTMPSTEATMASFPPWLSVFEKAIVSSRVPTPTTAPITPSRKRRAMVSRGGSEDRASMGAMSPALAWFPTRRRMSRSRKVLPVRKKLIAVTIIELVTDTRAKGEVSVSHTQTCRIPISTRQVKMTIVDRMSAGLKCLSSGSNRRPMAILLAFCMVGDTDGVGASCVPRWWLHRGVGRAAR
jgi:hypothetical protein